MPLPSPRLLFLAAVLLAGGCSSEPNWPAPKNTTDIVLQDDRRDNITTITLGDALHLILPPPVHPGTQWQILTLNNLSIRQVTDLKPIANQPGAVEITLQAIKITSRSVIRFAAIDPKVSTSTPDDFFAISIGIKH